MTDRLEPLADVPFVIKPATTADAVAVAQIHIESWRSAYRGIMPAEILAGLDVQRRTQRVRDMVAVSPPGLFVLTRAARVVGFCHIAAARDPDLQELAAGEITAIYLDPNEQRKGYGRALCLFALRELRQRGFALATLWVLQKNVSARLFYEALGFKPDGEEKFITHLKVTGVRYRRPLGPGLPPEATP